MATKPKLPTALRDFQRRFKSGYRWERTGGGHYRLRDSSGRLVEFQGHNITATASPSPGVERALEEQLTAVQAFKGQERKPPRLDQAMRERAAEARRAAVETRAVNRAAEARALHDRLEAAVGNVGKLDTPGIGADLGHIGAKIARDQGKLNMTPDLLAQSAYRVQKGGWVEARYAEVWSALCERLERSPEPIGEWYSLVREVRGLPADVVELRTPDGAEWPFRVELLPLDALLADESYQRPVAWAFVRREAARFDPALVGTIDVAQRAPSHYAILDGQQRTEITRAVGKRSIWCSIYSGLDVASEARFFLHKNRDRKNVHPYYTYRARLASHDEIALAIDHVIAEHGYKIAIGAPSPDERPDNIAIAAVEKAYERKRPDGSDSLTPTLRLLRLTTYGRPAGQSSILIRGVSMLFEQHDDDELLFDVLVDVVTRTGPELLIGRARDLQRSSSTTAEYALARVLRSDYNRHVGRERPKLKAA